MHKFSYNLLSSKTSHRKHKKISSLSYFFSCPACCLLLPFLLFILACKQRRNCLYNSWGIRYKKNENKSMKNSSQSWGESKQMKNMIHSRLPENFPHHAFHHHAAELFVAFPSSVVECRGISIIIHCWVPLNCEPIRSLSATNIETFSQLSFPFLSFSFLRLCHAQLVCCGWCILDIKFYFLFRSSFSCFLHFIRILIRLSFSPSSSLLH